MTETAICISCKKQMKNLQFGQGFQPIDGLAFSTRGHYGSGYFDPMDGSYLELCVCDECVEGLEKQGAVLRGEAPSSPSSGGLNMEELMSFEVIERHTEDEYLNPASKED